MRHPFVKQEMAHLRSTLPLPTRTATTASLSTSDSTLIGKQAKLETARLKETARLPNNFLFLLWTTEMTNSDLDKYYKALDKYALNILFID